MKIITYFTLDPLHPEHFIIHKGIHTDNSCSCSKGWSDTWKKSWTILFVHVAQAVTCLCRPKWLPGWCRILVHQYANYVHPQTTTSGLSKDPQSRREATTSIILHKRWRWSSIHLQTLCEILHQSHLLTQVGRANYKQWTEQKLGRSIAQLEASQHTSGIQNYKVYVAILHNRSLVHPRMGSHPDCETHITEVVLGKSNAGCWGMAIICINCEHWTM